MKKTNNMVKKEAKGENFLSEDVDADGVEEFDEELFGELDSINL